MQTRGREANKLGKQKPVKHEGIQFNAKPGMEASQKFGKSGKHQGGESKVREASQTSGKPD